MELRPREGFRGLQRRLSPRSTLDPRAIRLSGAKARFSALLRHLPDPFEEGSIPSSKAAEMGDTVLPDLAF